jgi:acyl-coenzyme A synthetase/AMP-(fatty) acid ligase
LEFGGRADRQVKVRGHRVELGEIESILSAHEGVGRAVVMARDGARGGKRLVAYVAAAGGQAPEAAELRGHLRGRLPEYMVPSAFVVLDSLPLMPNGKIDFRALPDPSDSPADLSADFVAPRTPIEEVLAHLWAEVLGLPRVGVRTTSSTSAATRS